jgi:aspartate kinase
MTEQHIRKIKPGKGIVLSQGFIGSDEVGQTTTLGREGSDYTAAIFAYCLDAEEVVIWKDVPGLLNADPKRFEAAVQLSRISYGEAIELAYYGASVIHPKTIKPLENKGIRLLVQSFADLKVQPSLISHMADFDDRTPSFIIKDNQMLCSVSPRDFSFMNEESLHKLFGILAELHVHANLIQVSAISLSFCADYEAAKLSDLLLRLQESYRMKYNTGLELLTIRHYNDQLLNEMCKGRHILLEQRSRTTAQMVLKTKASQ